MAQNANRIDSNDTFLLKNGLIFCNESDRGNCVEPSTHYFWAEGSDKGPSAQYLRPNLQPIYQVSISKCENGKLGESSNKSGPMIGNLAESSDKVETMELIAHQKRTLLRQWMKICLASFLWKSDLFFSHESDGGNRVRTFTRKKFG